MTITSDREYVIAKIRERLQIVQREGKIAQTNIIKNHVIVLPTDARDLVNLSLAITSLNVELAKLQKELSSYRLIIVTQWDETFAVFLQTSVNNIDNTDLVKLNNNFPNITTKADKILNLAIADFQGRTSFGNDLVKLAKRAPTSLKVEYFTLKVRQAFYTNQVNSIDNFLTVTPEDSARRPSLLISKSNAEAEALKASTAANNAKNAVEKKNKEVLEPEEGDKKKDAKKAIQRQDVIQSVISLEDRIDLAETPQIQTQLAIADEFLAAGVNNNIKTLFKAENPLGLQVAETQLIAGDFFDPRKSQLFMPKSKLESHPAYFYTVNHNGIQRLEFEDPDINTTDAKQKALRERVSLVNNAGQPTLQNPFVKGNSGLPAIYNQFSLVNIQVNYNEKMQIEDTFSEGEAVFVFGEAPKIWLFTGTLINDLYHGWFEKFMELWDNHIRASKLVEKKQVLVLAIPSSSLIIECYPKGISYVHSTDTETNVPFTMSAYIKSARRMPRISLAGETNKLNPKYTLNKMATLIQNLDDGKQAQILQVEREKQQKEVKASRTNLLGDFVSSLG